MTPLYPQKLALPSPTGGGRSVGIVRSRTKATEFSLVYIYVHNFNQNLQNPALLIPQHTVCMSVLTSFIAVWFTEILVSSP